MFDLNVEMGTSRDRLVVQSSRVASSVFFILSPTHRTCLILAYRNHEVAIPTETSLSIPLLIRQLPFPLFSQTLSNRKTFQVLDSTLHFFISFPIVDVFNRKIVAIFIVTILDNSYNQKVVWYLLNDIFFWETAYQFRKKLNKIEVKMNSYFLLFTITE